MMRTGRARAGEVATRAPAIRDGHNPGMMRCMRPPVMHPRAIQPEGGSKTDPSTHHAVAGISGVVKSRTYLKGLLHRRVLRHHLHEIGQFALQQGLAEQIALHIAAAQARDLGQLDMRFHAFGHDIES